MVRSNGGKLPTRRRTLVALAVALLMGFSLPVVAEITNTTPHVGASAFPAAPVTVSTGGAVPADYPSILNESTLVLFNNTLQPGDLLSVGSSLPSLEVFDPQTDEVFVEGFYSGIIDVVSGQSNEVVATIDAGQYANTLAYDSQNNNIYFGLQTADLVGTVNASTDLIQRTVNIGFEPLAMAADPVTGDLFVTGWNSTGTAFVAVLSGAYGTVLTTFPFGTNRFPVAGPNGIAYDPTDGNFYIPSIVGGVPQGTRGNLTVVNGTTPAVLTNLSLTFNPDAILYLPSTGDFFLGNGGGANLSIYDPTSTSVVGNVSLPNTPSLLEDAASQHRVYVGIDGNVSVVNSETNRVIKTFAVTRQPDGLAFDTLSSELYISDYVWNNVSVVNTSSYRPVAAVLLGAAPYNMAFDGANGDLYVADLLSSQLIVVNGSSDRVTGFVPLGSTPYGVAYDPRTRDVYVDNYYAGNVSVVSTATNSLIGYLPAGVQPWGIAYDGANHDLYVTNPGSDNITVLNPANGTVAGSINMSSAPGAIAYDPQSSRLFVGDYNVNNVSIYNASTNAFLANATVGTEPYTIAVDPGSGNAFVGNYASDNVTELGPDGQQLGSNIAAGVGVFGSTYNPRDGDLFVVSFTTDLVTVINSTSGAGVGGYQVGNGPVAAAVDPASGTVFIANYDSGSLTLLSPTVLCQPYNVTFTETGLPSGTPWSVRLDGVGHAADSDTIAYAEPNGSAQPYSVGPVRGFVATPEFGLAAVSGHAVTIPIAFQAQVGPTEYAVTFIENGLPTGAAWSVTFNASSLPGTGSSIGFLAPNGTGYAYYVAAVAGYRVAPGSGNLSVDGAPVTVTIQFTAVEYGVTFVESGLPTGSEWGVEFNGTTTDSSGSSVGFTAPNGTAYSFRIRSGPSGYTSSPSQGTLNISGANVSETIQWSAHPISGPYTVTFRESGLAAGTLWSVTANGSTQEAATSTIAFAESNGSFAFTVGSVSGYTANRTSGLVSVDGTNSTVAVGFAATSTGTSAPGSPAAPTFLGLPLYEGLALVVIPLVVVASVATALRARRRRTKYPPSSYER